MNPNSLFPLSSSSQLFSTLTSPLVTNKMQHQTQQEVNVNRITLDAFHRNERETVERTTALTPSPFTFKPLSNCPQALELKETPTQHLDHSVLPLETHEEKPPKKAKISFLLNSQDTNVATSNFSPSPIFNSTSPAPLTPSNPKRQKSNRGAKPFFSEITPKFAHLVSLKKEKIEREKLAVLNPMNANRCLELQAQIEKEEEFVLNFLLDKLFYTDHAGIKQPYLLAGMHVIQALGIMNLNTVRLLKIWTALPPNSRLDIVLSTHKSLLSYFGHVETRKEYHKHWTVTLSHEQRQSFVAYLQELNERWPSKVSTKGLAEKHKTVELINPYVMDKLKEVKNDEKKLRDFFASELKVQE